MLSPRDGKDTVCHPAVLGGRTSSHGVAQLSAPLSPAATQARPPAMEPPHSDTPMNNDSANQHTDAGASANNHGGRLTSEGGR